MQSIHFQKILHVELEEEQYIENYKTIDLMYENTPQYFVDKYLNIIKSIEINEGILDFVDEFTENWNDNRCISGHGIVQKVCSIIIASLKVR